MEFRGEHNRKLSTRKEMRWGSKGSFSLAIAGPKEGLWFDHETRPRRRHHRVHQDSSAAARLSTLSTMRRNMYPNCETDIIRRGRHHGRRHGRQLTTTATTRSASTQALAIWCDARPLRGTLAERYLRSRCIEVPTEALEVLRFHPRCPWGIGTRPAMVALVRDIITDEPIGIHRTALSADGSKIGAQGSRPERRRRDQAVALDGRRRRTPDRRRHRDHAVGIDPRFWLSCMVGHRRRRDEPVSGAAGHLAAHHSRRSRREQEPARRPQRRPKRDGRPRACGSAP